MNGNENLQIAFSANNKTLFNVLVDVAAAVVVVDRKSDNSSFFLIFLAKSKIKGEKCDPILPIDRLIAGVMEQQVREDARVNVNVRKRLLR